MPGQIYAVSTLGANWTVPYLSDNLRHNAQPYFRLRQFIDVHEAIGRNRGDTFNFDKAGNVATQGGTLVETATIPETQFVTNQGTATITEYGNSVPYSGKLVALGQFQVSSVTEQKLRDDQVKVLESGAGAEFVKTQFIAVCTASASAVVMSTNGTASATATSNLSAETTRSIVDFMKKKLIPKYEGTNFICVGSVGALGGFHRDTASGGFIAISQYTDRVAALFNGEVGTFYNTRFVEETGYLSNTIGSGSVYGQAVFFGSDAVVEAIAIPEEIRLKQSADYGRDLGAAWYALLGFKLIWDYAVDTEQHVVFVTSL